MILRFMIHVYPKSTNIYTGLVHVFICFLIMSDWEVSIHLRLSLHKFGYLIPGSNCQ